MARYLMTRKGALRASATDISKMLLVVGVGIAFAFVVALPVTWLAFARMSDRQLGRLSNIGQAYGFLAAIVSTFALIAIAATLILQAKQSKEARLAQWREAHADIMDMALEQPDLYGPCMADMTKYDSEDEFRQYLWTTKYLIYAKLGMETGDVPEKAVREEICAGMFASPVARKLWVKRREWVIAMFGDLGHFYSVVDEEYQRALQSIRINDPSSLGTSSDETITSST